LGHAYAKEAFMSWFNRPRDRRLKLDPVKLADMLHRMLAEEQTPDTVPEAYYLPEFVHEAFRERMLLYREALLLKALVSQADDDSLFVPLLRQYECILYPNGPEEAMREGRKQDVRSATADLGDLLTPRDDPNLSWSQRWFSEIGHKETNSITLMLFLYFWTDYSVAVQESVAAMVDD
jgi:hypothetical protein